MSHAVCYIGVNLESFVERKAQVILCQSGQAVPCEVCNSCIKVRNKTHPDLIWVREQKIKDIRDVTATSVMRPNDGEYKVYIFTEAENLSVLCQNALLKFTEEPPEYVRIIFTARTADMLLETMKSRLVFINADDGGDVHIPPEMTSIAQDFMNALDKGSEYKAATALSRIKTREELNTVLNLIAGEIRTQMHNSDNSGKVKRWAGKQEFLQACINDLQFNPNVTLTCTYIVTRIMEA